MTGILRYLFFLLPRMTLTTLPVACLVATLVGVGTMARAREDTAIKAAGVSVYRLMVPLLMVTALISGEMNLRMVKVSSLASSSFLP